MKYLTRDYFLSEVCTFHKWMGDSSFWKGHRPENALQGLLYTYFNTKGLKENDNVLFESTLNEYDERLIRLLLSGRYCPEEKDESK